MTHIPIGRKLYVVLLALLLLGVAWEQPLVTSAQTPRGEPRDVRVGIRYENGVTVPNVTISFADFDMGVATTVGTCITSEDGTCGIALAAGKMYLLEMTGEANGWLIAPPGVQGQALGHGEGQGLGLRVAPGTSELMILYTLIPRDDGYWYPVLDYASYSEDPLLHEPDPDLPEEERFPEEEAVATMEAFATPLPPVATIELPTLEPAEPTLAPIETEVAPEPTQDAEVAVVIEATTEPTVVAEAPAAVTETSPTSQSRTMPLYILVGAIVLGVIAVAGGYVLFVRPRAGESASNTKRGA